MLIGLTQVRCSTLKSEICGWICFAEIGVGGVDPQMKRILITLKQQMLTGMCPTATDSLLYCILFILYLQVDNILCGLFYSSCREFLVSHDHSEFRPYLQNCINYVSMSLICYYADGTMSDLRELEYKLYGPETLSICFSVLSPVPNTCSINIY